MKAKTKYNIIKSVVICGTPIYFLSISCFFALLKVDDIWGDMFEIGISNFNQWWTLILYRLLIYVPLPLFLGMFVFDKRFKYLSRVVIWYNWMFLVYLVIYGVLDIFAITLVPNMHVFDTLSSFILILGYIFTYIMKKPVSFDDTSGLLDKY